MLGGVGRAIQSPAAKALHKPRKISGFDGIIWRKIGEVLERAGLPTDSKSKFHRIRRTVASYYEAAGGNATELLGHSSRKITEKYLDRRIVARPQAIDRLWRLG